MKNKTIIPLVVIPKFLTNRECDNIVRMGNSKPLKEEKFGEEDGRYSHMTEITPCMWVDTYYRDRIHKRLHELNQKHFGYQLNKRKWLHGSFLRYNPSNFTNWHFDGYYGSEYPERKLSAVIMLSQGSDFPNKNGEYTGGQFELPFYMMDNFTDKRKSDMRGKGTLLLFPSHLFHRVTEVTSGTRYSLGYFMEGPAFK